ncbi:hypothetical protein F5B20DRAFT_579884 [Whalleya microplaca]|nr:hypothetical protein F5B20DRAFT_579884 [Whalleya microplaca]
MAGMSFSSSSPMINQGRSGYNKDGDSEDNKRCLVNFGRSGYNKDGDSEDDKRNFGRSVDTIKPAAAALSRDPESRLAGHIQASFFYWMAQCITTTTTAWRTTAFASISFVCIAQAPEHYSASAFSLLYDMGFVRYGITCDSHETISMHLHWDWD